MRCRRNTLSELLNNTFNAYMPEWIDNMLACKDLKPRDVTLMEFKKKISRVCLVGTGPSYNPCFFNDDFIVTNQSSYLRYIRDTGFYPDLCVITDANTDILHMVKNEEAQGLPMFAIATLADTRLFLALPFTFAFHHPYVRGIKILDMLFDKLQPETVRTSIVQVGNSMNAALLLMAHLMTVGTIPGVELHLNGVDFSYADGTVMEQFRLYAEDNKKIVSMLRENDYTITKEPGPSPLNEWILQETPEEAQ